MGPPIQAPTLKCLVLFMYQIKSKINPRKKKKVLVQYNKPTLLSIIL